MLAPPLQHWIDNSILLRLHQAVQTTQPILQHLSTQYHNQKGINNSLLPIMHGHNTHELLHRRWTRFSTTDQLQYNERHQQPETHQIFLQTLHNLCDPENVALWMDNQQQVR